MKMETETKQLTIIDHKEFGIELSQANLILEKFHPLQVKMQELENEYEAVIALSIEDPMTELKAKELGKKYMKIRTGRASIHKEEKAFFLNAGRFVDKIKNEADKATIDRENKLEEIEKYHANIEIERVKTLAAFRIDKLKEFEFDGSTLNLGTMDDNVWISFLSGTQMGFQAKKEQEKKAAEEAIAKENAEKEERERVAEENKRLKIEAEAKEKQLQEEREKAEAERKLIEAENNKKLAAAEAIRLAEQKKSDDLLEAQRKQAKEKAEKEKAIADATLKVEREAKEKLEAELNTELKAKKDAEDKAEAEKAATLRSKLEAEKAPDKEKLKSALNSVLFPVLDMQTAQGHKLYILIQEQNAKFHKWANEQINSL